MSNADAPPLVPQMMPCPIRESLTHVKPRAERDGKACLKPVQTVINGVPFAGPIKPRSR